MAAIKILTLVLLFVSSIVMLGWLFRPGSRERYKSYGLIPLRNDDKEIEGGRREQEK